MEYFNLRTKLCTGSHSLKLRLFGSLWPSNNIFNHLNVHLQWPKNLINFFVKFISKTYMDKRLFTTFKLLVFSVVQYPVVTLCTTRFGNKNFYVMLTQCICVFCVNISISIYSISWLVFVTEKEHVYRAVRTQHMLK